jgi:GNAT superfamily N-acetyltransferase
MGARHGTQRAAGDETVIRQVASLEELAQTFDAIMAQMGRPVTHDDRRFRDLERRFPQDRSMMLVAEAHGRIVGGALGFRCTLRAIGLEPAFRGRGLGRRLIQRFEAEAARVGCAEVLLAVGRGATAARRFFEHVGYRGRSRMSKGLPLFPGTRDGLSR